MTVSKPERPIIARIGLMSDTHMPERCLALPQTLAQVFADVDLILHAGDVGELWVLDQISQIAPVIAVHGNDETADAQRELPYQQLVTVAGLRILLWHSHFADRVDEMNSRLGDEMIPKLGRSVDRARRAGAKVVVFGHWHIPLVYQQDGITVINPGAIASGNAIVRQLHQTVARLDVYADGAFAITHVDLANPGVPFAPNVDCAAGFRAALNRFAASILTPELEAALPQLRSYLYQHMSPEDRVKLIGVLNRIAHRCWSGELDVITPELWLDEVRAAGEISGEVKALWEQKLSEVLGGGEAA
ncbi:MAG: metallophosphoesterase family protein [Caldilineaceae bacterium]